MYVGRCLILQEQGLAIGVSEGSLEIRRESRLVQTYPLTGLSELVLFYGVAETGAAIPALLAAGISVSRISYSGKHLCTYAAPMDGRILLRVKQYEVYFDSYRRLDLARRFVIGKIVNQKKEIRRLSRSRGINHSGVIDFLNERIEAAKISESIPSLMGEEGLAARGYFESWGSMLKPLSDEPWTRRTRRPPRSPEDALLSFAYALLSAACKGAVESTGLDSFLGFLHSPSAGRPSLSLDLMEEFRSDYVDRFVATLINRSEFSVADFIESLGSYTLKDDARKRFLQLWSAHMDSPVHYKLLSSPAPRRAIPYWQARVLSRTLIEGAKYTSYVTQEV